MSYLVYRQKILTAPPLHTEKERTLVASFLQLRSQSAETSVSYIIPIAVVLQSTEYFHAFNTMVTAQKL